MANTFKNAGIEVLASRTTLYTCPAATTAVIHALYLSNVDGTNHVDADIEITIDGGTTYRYIGKSLAIPDNSTLILDKPINLEAGDILAITASVIDRLEAVISILEIS
jgi:hypothetical protein